MTDLCEPIDGGVEVEVGLLAAVERSLGVFAELAVQLEHAKDLLDRLYFIPRDDLVRFAQRAHDRERRVEQGRLRHTQAADNLLL